MNRKAYLVTICLTCLLSASCASIVGTWHRDTLSLIQDKFPIDVVTFDESGAFTATGRDQSNKHTWTGAYRWTNEILTVYPVNQESKSFSARIKSDDELIMADEHTRDNQEVSFYRIP